jgi:hypothetical protein
MKHIRKTPQTVVIRKHDGSGFIGNLPWIEKMVDDGLCVFFYQPGSVLSCAGFNKDEISHDFKPELPAYQPQMSDFMEVESV